MGMGYRCQLKPKTPSSSARFSYINRQGKYERDSDDLVFSADHNMPEFAKNDAAVFWENCDEHERTNARRCLEFELNLPQELKTLDQQIACVEQFIDSLNAKAGKFPISYAIHNDKNGANPHVHLMLSERTLDGIERPAEQFFKRANSKNPERGGNKKSLFFNRSSENVLWTRASWANSCNETLIKNGFDARFDSRPKHVQRAEAIKNGDLVRAVQLSTLTETHEGPHVGGIRKRLAAGQLERGDVELEILEKLDSNDTIKAFNTELQLFAVTATDQHLLAFLGCENAADRVAFIANLIEPQPAPEAQQQQEQKHEHNTRSATQVAERRTSDSDGVREHEQYLFIVQERRNNQILRDAQARSESCDIQGRDGDVHYQPMAVQPEAQSTDRDARDGLHDVRGERVEPEPQPLAAVVQPEPQPEPEHLHELSEIVRRIEQIDLSIEDQRDRHAIYSVRAEHIKNDYQTLKRQQNALAASEANQIMPVKILNKLLKGIGFKADSELLEPELERLSRAFNNAKSQREASLTQLTSLKNQRDELMQLDVSEPLREAARLRREANASAGDAYVLARKSLTAAKVDKSFRYYAERDLQMIRQDLNSDDYTIEDMQSVQQRAIQLVDTINDEVQKQIARQQHSQRPQSQPQPQDSQRPSRGPRL